MQWVRGCSAPRPNHPSTRNSTLRCRGANRSRRCSSGGGWESLRSGGPAHAHDSKAIRRPWHGNFDIAKISNWSELRLQELWFGIVVAVRVVVRPVAVRDFRVFRRRAASKTLSSGWSFIAGRTNARSAWDRDYPAREAWNRTPVHSPRVRATATWASSASVVGSNPGRSCPTWRKQGPDLPG